MFFKSPVAFLAALFAGFFSALTTFAVVDAQELRAAPDRTPEGDVWRPLYDGIDVTNWSRQTPLYRVFAARIDLATPGLVMKATPRNKKYEANKNETRRQTTLKFLEENELFFAINTNYYLPFNAISIMTEGNADVSGLAVADGVVVSPAQEGFISLLFKKDEPPEIKRVFPEDNLDGVLFAFSGRKMTLSHGVPCQRNEKAQRDPRTAVGLSEDRRFLYFIVIDGRQEKYSIGATVDEEGKELLRCGAYDGFNLDGGGSSTMVVRGADGRGVVLNRPCNNTSDSLRNNANAFGVRTSGKLKSPVRDGRK